MTATADDVAKLATPRADIKVQFAQKAVIVHDDRILLVRKSADDPQQPMCWELPGGRMKSAEDVDEHIRREILEEVGLSVDPGDPLGMWSWEMKAGRGDLVRVVAVARRCSVRAGDATLANNDESDHLSHLEWYPVNRIAELNVIPSQRVFFERISRTWPAEIQPNSIESASWPMTVLVTYGLQPIFHALAGTMRKLGRLV